MNFDPIILDLKFSVPVYPLLTQFVSECLRTNSISIEVISPKFLGTDAIGSLKVMPFISVCVLLYTKKYKCNFC